MEESSGTHGTDATGLTILEALEKLTKMEENSFPQGPSHNVMAGGKPLNKCPRDSEDNGDDDDPSGSENDNEGTRD